jgi:hypothetical protein
MTQVITDVAGVINLALAKIGYRLRVGSLYDGTLASKKALDVYGQERDALLAAGEWDFCERTVTGVLLKAAPASYLINPWSSAYPALPWLFEYAYPADAVKIRTVKLSPVIIPNYDPRYNRFSVDNDSSLSPAPEKVVLCNVQNAILVYAGQVTSPGDWTPEFLDALADRLGRALAPVLVDLNAAKFVAGEEQAETTNASEIRG